MKKWTVWLLIVLLAPGAAAQARGEEAALEEMLEAFAQNRLNNLIDVREKEAYMGGALPGADNIPLGGLEAALQSVLDKGFSQMDTPVYLYGETPEEGKAAADILTKLGFTNARYLSSFGAWTGPVVKPEQILGSLVTRDIYGNAVDASLIAGKKLVMVNVWATYCGPCLDEMEGLGNLAREMADKDMLLIGLVTDCSNGDFTANEKQTAAARVLAEERKADYPHLLPNLEMYRNVLAYITAVPTTFFLDGEGRMVGKAYTGSRSESDWKAIIEAAAASLGGD